jgi:hypothetical protein
MQANLRRTFLLFAAFTMAAALIVGPVDAAKKKNGDKTTKTSQSTSSKSQPAPTRDAKGHFVKKGGAPEATTPAPAAAAPTRDAKGHFVKKGGAPEATTPAPAAAAPERDAKGHFVKKAGSPEAATPAPAAAAPTRDEHGRFVRQSSAPAAALSSPPPTMRSNIPAAGNGQVWVNLDSKVYHRQGDRWFGKTKNGKYMSEDDAVRAGYRAAKSAEKNAAR